MRVQALWLLLCCVGLPAAADTVWLNNGDRLTGTIVLLEGGKLVLQTKYAGRVLINWPDVSTLRSDKPLLVKQSQFDAEQSKSLAAAGQGMVLLENHQSKTLPLASITQIVPPRPFVDDLVWEGNLDGKLDLERDEDDVDDLRVKLDTTLKHDRWRYSLEGSQRYETENGETSENNWDLTYDQDYFFTDQWFARASYQVLRDKFEDINRQVGFGFGPGYRFYDNALGHFELIGELNQFKLRTDEGEVTFESASLGWDYKRLLWGSRLEFFAKGDAATPFLDDVDYVVDAETGLRYRLNEWLRMSLLYEASQVRGFGGTLTAQEFNFGVGVGW